LETNHGAVKESHTKLVEQIELLNKALREERRRAIQIESELNAAQLSSATVKELNMIIEDLRRDKRVLQVQKRKGKGGMVEERNSPPRLCKSTWTPLCDRTQG
jgi:hypothetical protein